MTTRTQLKAGKLATNHNQALRVRSMVKAGKVVANHSETMERAHNEALQVRSAVRAGRMSANHNETLGRTPVVSMRRQPLTVSRKDDRLELLVVRAGLRAGRRARIRVRR